MVGVYNIIVRNNTVFKYLNKETEVGSKLSNKLKNQRENMIFKAIIENSYKYDIIGPHIVKGYIIGNKFNYKSPLIKGPRLDNLPQLFKLSYIHQIFVLYAIGELLTSLTEFKIANRYISGDWMPHNIIWNVSTYKLVNVDLEGFYTYSPNGLDLSWEGNECNILHIKRRLSKIMRLLCLNIYNNICINTRTNVKYITTLNIPYCYQLWFPFSILDLTTFDNDKLYMSKIKNKLNIINISNNEKKVCFHNYVYLKFYNNIPYITTKEYCNDIKFYFKFVSNINISKKQKPIRNIINH